VLGKDLIQLIRLRRQLVGQLDALLVLARIGENVVQQQNNVGNANFTQIVQLVFAVQPHFTLVVGQVVEKVVVVGLGIDEPTFVGKQEDVVEQITRD
jgi:hypothetical protein